MTDMTVGALIDVLSAYDSNLPILVSTHYDNGVGYSTNVDVSEQPAYPEGYKSVHMLDDPDDMREDSNHYVVIFGNGY